MIKDYKDKILDEFLNLKPSKEYVISNLKPYNKKILRKKSKLVIVYSFVVVLIISLSVALPLLNKNSVTPTGSPSDSGSPTSTISPSTSPSPSDEPNYFDDFEIKFDVVSSAEELEVFSQLTALNLDIEALMTEYYNIKSQTDEINIGARVELVREDVISGISIYALVNGNNFFAMKQYENLGNSTVYKGITVNWSSQEVLTYEYLLAFEYQEVRYCVNASCIFEIDVNLILDTIISGNII